MIVEPIEASTPSRDHARHSWIEDAVDGDSYRLRVGRYHVLRLVGQGGMGVVYEAFDPQLERRVALKILHPLSEGDTSPQAAAVARTRLIREARSLARISHPNIVAIFDVGESSRREVYLAMELVQGQSLRDVLTAQRLSWSQRVGLLIQAGDGLAAAHAAGLVHRDFKPENAMVGDDGVVKVLDFGLAKGSTLGASVVSDLELAGTKCPTVTRSLTQGDDQLNPADTRVLVSQAGMVLGTPAYMAPEQLRGEGCDAQSDLFAFCSVLFEALNGTRPFPPTATTHRLHAIAKGEVRWPHRTPRWLRNLIAQGLAYRKEDRGGDLSSLLAALRQGLACDRRRAWWLPGSGAAVIATLAGALALTGKPTVELALPCRDPSAPIDALWNDARRQALGQGFHQTQSNLAAELWQHTQSELDLWRDTWVQSHALLCRPSPAALDVNEATAAAQWVSVEDLERTRTCLTNGLTELGALFDVWQNLSAERVLDAPAAVRSLSDPKACRDRAVLRRRAPLPIDPRVRREVEIWREQIVASQMYTRQADIAGAARVLQAIEKPVRATGDLALLAEFHLAGAAMAERSSHTTHEANQLEAAWIYARASGHHHAAARATLRRFYVHAYALHEVDDRQALLTDAQAAVDAADSPDLIAAMLRQRGIFVGMDGELQQTVRYFHRALAYIQQSEGASNLNVAQLLGDLGITSTYLADYAAAATYHHQAFAMYEALLGQSHPKTLEAATRLAEVRVQQGDLQNAWLVAQHTYQRGQIGGLGPLTQARSAAALGRVLYARGEHLAAQAAFSEYQAAQAQVGQRNEPTTPWAETELAQVLLARGDVAAASDLAQQGLDKVRAQVQVNQDAVIKAVLCRAATLLRTPQWRRADPLLREASQLLQVPRADRMTLLPELQHLLGDRALRQNHLRAAIDEYQKALASEVEAHGPPQRIVEHLQALARALLQQGERGAASAVLQQAQDWLARLDGSHHVLNASVGQLVVDIAQVQRFRAFGAWRTKRRQT